MTTEIEDWIIGWFEKKTDMNHQELISKMDESYLESGWIDSFQFISLISDCEEHFNLTFANDQFQDRDFATINGLSNVIREINERKP